MGFSRDHFWIRVSLHSTEEQKSDWFLQLADSRVEWLDWYLVREGVVPIPIESGTRRPQSPLMVDDRFPTLPFTIDPGETLDIVLHLRSQTRIRIPLRLYSASGYAARDRHVDSIYMFCFGSIAALVFAGLVFGLAVDIEGSLMYSLSALTSGLYHLGLSGYWGTLRLPGWEFGSMEGALFFFQLSILAMLLYLESFFGLVRTAPLVSRVIRKLLVVGSLLLLAIPFLPYWPMNVFLEGQLAMFGISAMILAIWSAKRGDRVAIFYLLTWSSFWISITLVAYYGWRKIPATFDPVPYIFLITNLSLGSFLFCIADRARLQRKMKREAEEELSHLQSEQNSRLEEQVRERTLSLNEAKEQAELANRYKEMFLANISHEIRTPLSALISLSQAMHMQSAACALSPQFTRMLEQVRSGGRHLNLMLTNLLDATSANAGRQNLRMEEVDLQAWSRQVGDILEPIAHSKGLSLEWVDSSLAGRKIRSDPMRLSQILINLVHNAVKFTTSGTVRVVFAINESSFSFEVHDEGPGLPAPAEVLYTAFEQSRPVESDPTHGVGLGLYVVQSNVASLEGEITATSPVKGGTTFRVVFTKEFPDHEIPAR